MKEYLYEQLFNVNTRINRNLKQQYSKNYYYYEPTPYIALEELILHHHFGEQDHVVDFGCGLGRLHFFLHHHLGLSVTGIEMNYDFYKQALENLSHYKKTTRKNTDHLQFHWIKAEDYQIQPEENQFYFFNPFSVHIFRKVLFNLMTSHEQVKRRMSIILYYVQDDYLFLLEKETNFKYVQEIRIPFLYDRDEYERFLIYEL